MRSDQHEFFKELILAKESFANSNLATSKQLPKGLHQALQILCQDAISQVKLLKASIPGGWGNAGNPAQTQHSQAFLTGSKVPADLLHRMQQLVLTTAAIEDVTNLRLDGPGWALPTADRANGARFGRASLISLVMPSYVWIEGYKMGCEAAAKDWARRCVEQAKQRAKQRHDCYPLTPSTAHLLQALQAHQTSDVQRILSSASALDSIRSYDPATGDFPLHCAIKSGSGETALTALLKAMVALGQSLDQLQADAPVQSHSAPAAGAQSALVIAVLANQPEAVALLCSWGAQISSALFLAAKLPDGTIYSILKQWADHEDMVLKRNGQTCEDLAKMTREEQAGKAMPPTRLCLDMLALLKQHVIGQDVAMQSVAQSMLRHQDGYNGSTRPLVMLFVGPSGSGKTEAAKQLQYLGSGRPFINFNMAEYFSEHMMACFKGAPPGYSGQKEGHLSEQLRDKPNAVVLLDEIGRAHPSILGFFLAVFDNGEFQNGLGRTVKCNSAIFVMTSNTGAELIKSAAMELRGPGWQNFTPHFVERQLRPQLQAHGFAPEVFFRIHTVVLFPPMLPADINGKIAAAEHILKGVKLARSPPAIAYDLRITWHQRLSQQLATLYNADGGIRALQNSCLVQSTVDKLTEVCQPFQDLGTLRGRSFCFDYQEGRVIVAAGSTPRHAAVFWSHSTLHNYSDQSIVLVIRHLLQIVTSLVNWCRPRHPRNLTAVLIVFSLFYCGVSVCTYYLVTKSQAVAD
ncbi:TPA: hypothetical protein ACH3X2_000764 [Trebouxia sp. C0005]